MILKLILGDQNNTKPPDAHLCQLQTGLIQKEIENANYTPYTIIWFHTKIQKMGDYF